MGPDELGGAIALATMAHATQMDKAGEPYILHPLRVMFRMTTHEERIVAVLHDVVEDTTVTLQALRETGLAPSIINALDALTHRDGESYEAYIERIKASSALARRVKLADLSDNLNKGRIPFPSERDTKRWAKYERAYATLTEE